jgi:hypothetical protein
MELAKSSNRRKNDILHHFMDFSKSSQIKKSGLVTDRKFRLTFLIFYAEDDPTTFIPNSEFSNKGAPYLRDQSLQF